MTYLQSALILARVSHLAWQRAQKPGNLLTAPVAGPSIDVAGYRARDAELAYRDVAVGMAIKEIVRYLNTAWQSQISQINLDGVAEVLTPRTGDLGLVAGTAYSAVLVPFINPGSISLTAGVWTTTDDSRGLLIPSKGVISGTIDYNTGLITVILFDVVDLVSAAYQTKKYAEAQSEDMDAGQLSAAGAPTAVRHLANSDFAVDAQRVDKDLYRRDLILLDALALALEFVEKVPHTGPLDALVPEWIMDVSLKSLATLDQTWSQGQAASSDFEVGPSLTYGISLFSTPDKNLAYRDNVLAYYVSSLSNILTPIGLIEAATKISVRFLDDTAPEQFDTFQYRRETEPYVLVEEDSRYRRFASLPNLSLNRLSLLYDKQYKTLRWYTEDLSRVDYARPVSNQTVGLRSSQVIELVPSTPVDPDCAWYRQKAAFYKTSRYTEQIAISRDYLETSAAPTVAEIVSATGCLVYGDSAIFTKAGSVQIANFAVDGTSVTTELLYYKFNILVKCLTLVAQASSTYSGSDSNPTSFTLDDEGGIVLPAPDTANQFFDVNNTPRVSYSVTLPPGSYRVSFAWKDRGSVETEASVSIRYGGRSIWLGSWQATALDELQISDPVNFEVVDTDPQLLSLVVNSLGSTSELHILSFSVQKLGDPNTVACRLNLTYMDHSGSYTPISTLPVQFSRFTTAGNQVELVSTGWLDSSLIGGRSILHLKVDLLDDPSTPLQIVAIDLRRRLSVQDMVDGKIYARLRSSLLSQAANRVSDAYARSVYLLPKPEFRVKVDEIWYWEAASTVALVAKLEHLEPRLQQAFRAPCAGDVGRPALVPTGLELQRDGTVLAHLDAFQSQVQVQPLQAWMIQFGLLVAHEDFWTVYVPELPAVIVQLT